MRNLVSEFTPELALGLLPAPSDADVHLTIDPTAAARDTAPLVRGSHTDPQNHGKVQTRYVSWSSCVSSESSPVLGRATVSGLQSQEQRLL